MRLIDIDPIIERLKNAIYLGKRIGEDTANMEAVLADVEAAPTYNDDLISRQAALDAVINGVCLGCDCDVIDKLKALPTAEPTLYGYKIEHLAYIATVMEKEGVTAEYAVRTFDDIGRVIKMLIEEVQAKVEEALK